jgi:antitoxin component YwqK of YwqJK toxin-antitoxin module
MTKFKDYNSSEKAILKEVFNTIPMIDSYMANIVEEYIYSIVREYYCSLDGGSLMCEYRTKFGEKDGECKYWWPNGELSFQTYYVDGKRHGEYKQWHHEERTYNSNKVSGQLIIQSTYVKGKLHGEYKEWWFDTGKIKIQTNYIEGKPQDKSNEISSYYYDKMLLVIVLVIYIGKYIKQF